MLKFSSLLSVGCGLNTFAGEKNWGEEMASMSRTKNNTQMREKGLLQQKELFQPLRGGWIILSLKYI